MQLLIVIRLYGSDEAFCEDSDIVLTGQHLFYGFDSLWFTLLDGSSKDWSEWEEIVCNIWVLATDELVNSESIGSCGKEGSHYVWYVRCYLH